MTEIESFDITGRVKKITTTQGEYSGGAVIIANGARRRHLNCPGEEEFAGRGVSYCATCDGNFFKNQDVAIAGGGKHGSGGRTFSFKYLQQGLSHTQAQRIQGNEVAVRRGTRTQQYRAYT